MVAGPRRERIASASGCRASAGRTRASGVGSIAREHVTLTGQERRQCGRPQAYTAINKEVAPRTLM
jgi:hypothetical protein